MARAGDELVNPVTGERIVCRKTAADTDGAERHLLDPKDPRLHIRHRACGAELAPLVVCESCREPVHASEVEYGATDRVGA